MSDAPRDRLTAEENARLHDHFDAIENNFIAPLTNRMNPSLIEVTSAVTTIDTLAGAHTPQGKLEKRWRNFTADYLPATINTPDWYDELRCRLLHNQSAGPGIYFTNDPNAVHGEVHSSGGTIVATGDFLSHTATAFYRFRDDVYAQPDAGRRALGHFDTHPPLRLLDTHYRGAQSLSASPMPAPHPSQGAPNRHQARRAQRRETS